MVSVKIHKPSISYLKNNKIYEKEKSVHNYLTTKYSNFDYSYSALCINNLMFNERCRIVARFKDYLILDDMTEFLRRLYSKKELKRRLKKIFNFYDSYSKIFPNYMILPEGKYLYRNIRKKQKMIDAFNQIKKEEEENRNSLKRTINNKEKGEMMVFSKSIQESINRYHPSGTFLFNSVISELMKNKNNNANKNIDSNYNSLISISLNKAYSINNKMVSNNIHSKQNSFDYDYNEITLNSVNSLINIVQILNKKFDNNINYNNDFKETNNKKNNKIIKNYNDKLTKNKNVKKEIKNKKTYKINNINDNNIKNKDKKNISTPPKNISPGQNHLMKRHNHQKSALNNNKKFISHKQAVSVSNNNNTIKIINNINNIIINDANINNKEMVININTNYFELNNTNLNTINKISSSNEKMNKTMNKNIKNALIKKAKINSKSRSKETSLNNKKKHIFHKKLSTNFKTHNNFINNTLEEKRIHTYTNNLLNSINYDNKNNIINNNVIHIHNNTTNNTNYKNNKIKIRKENNDNKLIKGINEYKSINIKNLGNTYNNKLKNSNIKMDRNKKSITIEVDHYNKNKKSQSKIKKKLEILIDRKKFSNDPILNKQKMQNKRTIEISNTEGNNNYNINSNTYSNYYISTDNKKNNRIDKDDFNGIKSNQIKTKLNKKVMSRKQKTNSLHISNKNNFFSSFNNNKVIKDLNSLKRNNITNNINFINEHAKSNHTQGNLEYENPKVKKHLLIKENNDMSENKYRKISAKEMKEKYHKFMQGNKIIHGSYDTSNRLHLFKKFSSLYNSHNVNINEISQRKTLDIKSPFKINCIINTPGSKISNKNVNSNISSNIILESNIKNYERISFKRNKQIHKNDGIKDKNKYFIYKINSLKNKTSISDNNNKKMKYVKK